MCSMSVVGTSTMSSPTVDFSNLNILIVENHALMRRLVAEMLKGFGVRQIRQARDVPQAANYLFSESFDAMILDFFLGDLDGGDLTRKIRNSEKCPNRRVPILLITAEPEHHKVIKARDAGVNAMMAKPFAPKDLYARLHTLLAKPSQFVITKDYIGPSRSKMAENAPAANPARRLLRGGNPITERPHVEPDSQEDLMFL